MIRSSTLLLVLLFLVSCSAPEDEFHLQGNAQGTTFSIKYHGDKAKDYSEVIAQLLTDIDMSMSLWRKESFITKVNSSGDSILKFPPKDVHFIPVLEKSGQIFRQTKGAFDPTIYPLVRAWGFGAIPPDSDSIPDVDSLMKAFDVGKWTFKTAEVGPDIILMKSPRTQLDFNGIAQGYSVDALGVLLEKKGINDYMVEIGGELLAKGKKKDGTAWKVGIEKPQDGPRVVMEELELMDEAIATSGSYRKFNERDGKRYSHCIDPRTGYPVDHNLLSVTVVAPTCMEADAYATAFLVMGVKKTLRRLEQGLGSKLDVLMVYDENGENRMEGTGRFKDL